MARTTIAIDDDLLRQLKERAAREERTLQDVTKELLRHAMTRRKAGPPYKLVLKGWRAKTRSGVDFLDRDKLFDLMDGRG